MRVLYVYGGRGGNVSGISFELVVKAGVIAKFKKLVFSFGSKVTSSFRAI